MMYTSRLSMSLGCMVSTLCLLAIGALGDDLNSGLVDMSKVRNNRHTMWIERTFWPSETTLSSKEIDPSEVQEEVLTLSGLLKIVLGTQCLPSEAEYMAHVKAVLELHGENDVLLLRYTVPDIGEIEIQDGKALYVTLVPSSSSSVSAPEVLGANEGEALANWVRQIASTLFNLLDFELDKDMPDVFISSADIGGAKCGNIKYDKSFPPPEHWYSAMSWWTDGKRITFSMGKFLLLHPDKNFREMAGPPAEVLSPRKFQRK